MLQLTSLLKTIIRASFYPIASHWTMFATACTAVTILHYTSGLNVPICTHRHYSGATMANPSRLLLQNLHYLISLDSKGSK